MTARQLDHLGDLGLRHLERINPADAHAVAVAVQHDENRLFARLEETGGMQIPLRAPAGGRNDRRRPEGAPSTDPLPVRR